MKRLVPGLCLMVLALTLSACGLPYYFQAIGGQMRLLRQRTPIENILADPEQSFELKQELGRIDSIVRFAVERLGLPESDSYTSYVDLDRTYAVWNVIAAEEFSIEPLNWCFPFAGCVAYRGYFDRDAALRYQEKLEADGYDTFSGGARAYSTLGYFKDPVLNTMLGGGARYIASLLIHEIAHQQFYLKGDSELNEAFATAVEESGTELWLAETGQAEELEGYRARLARREAFAELIGRQQARLAEIYASAMDADAMRAAKAEAFTAMFDEYESMKSAWGGNGDYDAWFEASPNNASLAALATYRRWVPALRWRVETRGFVGFYEDMRQLAERSEDDRRALLQAWRDRASAGVGAP